MVKKRLKTIIYLPFLAAILAACSPGGAPDALRDRATEGVAFAIQADLHKGASEANLAAAVYDDNVRQSLVGGDFFYASAAQSNADAVLKSVENLSGSYVGNLPVNGATDTLTIASKYDPQIARQDRWYPTDELLVDPGPNTKLVGFSFTSKFPEPLQELSLANNVFTSRSEDIGLTWKAGDGEQMNTNVVATCYGQEGKTVSFPTRIVLGADDGSETFKVSQVIPADSIVNAVGAFQYQVATIISSVLLNVATSGLVDVPTIKLEQFGLTHCDVDIVLFREKETSVIAGSDVIMSTSDKIRFTYQPAQ